MLLIKEPHYFSWYCCLSERSTHLPFQALLCDLASLLQGRCNTRSGPAHSVLTGQGSLYPLHAVPRTPLSPGPPRLSTVLCAEEPCPHPAGTCGRVVLPVYLASMLNLMAAMFIPLCWHSLAFTLITTWLGAEHGTAGPSLPMLWLCQSPRWGVPWLCATSSTSWGVYPDLLAFPHSPFWSQQTAFQLTCRNLLIFTFGVPRHVGTNGPPPQFCSSACEPQSEVISHNLSVHL